MHLLDTAAALVRIPSVTGHEARAAVEAAVADACPEARLTWTGGQFASGATPAEHPWVRRVVAESGGRPVGVPYGADMRLFTARRIPTVMCGTGGLGRAHAVDEWVDVAELERLRRLIAEVVG